MLKYLDVKLKYIVNRLFGMTVSRIYVITLLTATIVIATTAAITTMPIPLAEA
jgi:hypothetical protein